MEKESGGTGMKYKYCYKAPPKNEKGFDVIYTDTPLGAIVDVITILIYFTPGEIMGLLIKRASNAPTVEHTIPAYCQIQEWCECGVKLGWLKRKAVK